MTVASNREGWVEEKEYGYDSERYDPEELNDSCLECGAVLRGFGDRSGFGQSCPECETVVFVR